MWLIIGVSGATCSGKSTLAQFLHKELPGSYLVCQDDFFLPVDSERHTLIPALNHFNWELMTSLNMEQMHTVIENILSSDSDQSVTSLDSLVQAANRVKGSRCYAECYTDNNETLPNVTDGCYKKLTEDNPIPNQTHSVVTDQPITGVASSQTNTISDCADKQISDLRILIIEGFLLFNDKKLANLCHHKYFLTLTRDQCWARRSVRIYDPPDVPGYFDLCVWPEYEKYRDQVFKEVPDVTVIDGNRDRTSVLKQVLLEIVHAAQALVSLQKN
jgi:Uridine kinase